MTLEDGLVKDGLSYRADLFTINTLAAIYTYGSLVWLVFLVAVAINSVRARPIKKTKQRDYELLHTGFDRQLSYSARDSMMSSRSGLEKRSRADSSLSGNSQIDKSQQSAKPKKSNEETASSKLMGSAEEKASEKDKTGSSGKSANRTAKDVNESSKKVI
ncbi:hypothetical protein DICVIV_09292 [Dictyocaulus viviparus]|uniref:Uncharacterized protein n=1 Tax=Dictyocaulus viviparus TaxID=29172 RepID=A0A0D8XJA1_DICVI|nr:hypothetical protein DICVIV_09292 [Dictyocaulus viviparus]